MCKLKWTEFDYDTEIKRCTHGTDDKDKAPFTGAIRKEQKVSAQLAVGR